MTATAYTALARIAGGSRLSLSVHIREKRLRFRVAYLINGLSLISHPSWSGREELHGWLVVR